MVQRVKQQTSELMNKQINNTLKALEETGVNLWKTWEWEIFPIYNSQIRSNKKEKDKCYYKNKSQAPQPEKNQNKQCNKIWKKLFVIHITKHC